jgi:predicted GNAT family acetyltransferase
MRWFVAQRLDLVFLHYVADNPVSAPFWTRLGFAPYQEVHRLIL